MSAELTKATAEKKHPVIAGYVLPGLPHPLLCPEENPGWQKLNTAFAKVRAEIEASGADVIILYSTMWPSVVGHQIQADPNPEWVHVDEQFHDLGSIPYKFKMDAEFAQSLNQTCQKRGLHSRTVAYKGFPIDTGSVTALKLINPDNKIPAVILSSNIYSDRTETVVLGKSVVETLEQTGKKAVAVLVSTLSNRLHSKFIEAKNDKIFSQKDEEWNQKMLEFFEKGRLEDLSQLSRQIQKEARVKKVVNFKSFWWLASVMGQHNQFSGTVFEYQAIYGTGAAVVGLKPAKVAARDLEFDEADPEVYSGGRNVLGPSLEDLAKAEDAEDAE